MKTTTRFVALVVLPVLFGAAPTFAQSPLALSALSIKQVPPPPSPQIKCVAYTGKASFSLADCRMTADRLTAYYSDGKLSKVIAKGHVTLLRRGTAKASELKATGETATYTYETGDITLKGRVELLRYGGGGNAFGSQAKSVSYNVGDGSVGISLPRYNFYTSDKVY